MDPSPTGPPWPASLVAGGPVWRARRAFLDPDEHQVPGSGAGSYSSTPHWAGAGLLATFDGGARG
eukprot:6816831-Alexandrium_andersonii.AAC.1